MKKTRFGKAPLLISAAAALALLTQCTPTMNVRGNLLQDEQVAEVRAGTDTESDVLRKLGSPTTRAPFDEKVWYYFGQETEKRGILDPKVTKERIVAVHFDETGLVSSIEDVDPQRVDIPYVREKTPTSGSNITIMQQFLGNLGRFNKSGSGERSGPDL